MTPKIGYNYIIIPFCSLWYYNPIPSSILSSCLSFHTDHALKVLHSIYYMVSYRLLHGLYFSFSSTTGIQHVHSKHSLQIFQDLCGQLLPRDRLRFSPVQYWSRAHLVSIIPCIACLRISWIRK